MMSESEYEWYREKFDQIALHMEADYKSFLRNEHKEGESEFANWQSGRMLGFIEGLAAAGYADLSTLLSYHTTMAVNLRMEVSET